MKRFLLIAAVLGLIALALKGRAKQREAWHGISEAEARDRLDERLPSRMPEEKRDAMKEKIVGRMREKGVFEEAEQGDAEEAETEPLDVRDEATASDAEAENTEATVST